MRATQNLGILLLTALLCPQALAQETEDEFSQLIADAKTTFSMRHRFEMVDQDGFSEDAKASTLKTRLSMQSGSYRGFDILVEFDDVRELGWDEFNAGGGNTPERSGYPVVADPEGTEVNQAYVNYNNFENLSLRLGRQRINLDNQRFVGGVGWRQNEQTFDAFKADWKIGELDVIYSYVNQVRGIFGEQVPAGKNKQDNTHFLNVSRPTPIGKAVGYYYHLDSKDTANLSTATIGLRLANRYTFGEQGSESEGGWSLRYEAEFASQSDIGDNPNDISAQYTHLVFGAATDRYDFAMGRESLNGTRSLTANEAFQTPLATGHMFNGWADVFLTTPALGLEDTYLKLQASHNSFIFDVRYHEFYAHSGGADYGNEVDFRFGYKFNDHIRGDLYWANFEGEDGRDVNKIWLMTTLKF